MSLRYQLLLIFWKQDVIFLSHHYTNIFLICYEVHHVLRGFNSVQFSGSVVSDSLRPHECTPGLPVHHQLPEFTETHIYQVSDAIQPSHPLSSPFPPAPNPSQHQSLFQCVTINCGKFWNRWEYQTTRPASWEICMQVRKQQLDLDMEQQTGSK